MAKARSATRKTAKKPTRAKKVAASAVTAPSAAELRNVAKPLDELESLTEEYGGYDELKRPQTAAALHEAARVLRRSGGSKAEVEALLEKAREAERA